jgi:hypothetical protein
MQVVCSGCMVAVGTYAWSAFLSCQEQRHQRLLYELVTV